MRHGGARGWDVRLGEDSSEAYKAVRAHELMLNEATSRFEHAMLAPLMVLNGGAAVAFLTLMGALLGKDSRRQPDLTLALVAAAVWAGGLLAAAAAVRFGARNQWAIGIAHRLRRERLEGKLYSDIANLLKADAPERTRGVEGPTDASA